MTVRHPRGSAAEPAAGGRSWVPEGVALVAAGDATRQVPDGEPGPLRIDDPRLMRALAHPARVAILERLAGGATATATECAEVCGLSPSATSYHLRALAKLGMVEEAPSRGDQRERLWRGRVRGWATAVGPRGGAEAQAAEHLLASMTTSRADEKTQGWLDRMGEEDPDWYEAAMVSQSLLEVTREELAELNEQVLALLRPYTRAYRKGPTPGDARAVRVIYRAFPEGETRR